MHKRLIVDLEQEFDQEEIEFHELIKRPKPGQYTHYLDYHPTVVDIFAPNYQFCRHCEEPISEHHFYTIEKYWDTMTPLSILRCDRKMFRSYFHKYTLTSSDGKAYEYETFLDSYMYDTSDLFEGRKTQ